MSRNHSQKCLLLCEQDINDFSESVNIDILERYANSSCQLCSILLVKHKRAFQATCLEASTDSSNQKVVIKGSVLEMSNGRLIKEFSVLNGRMMIKGSVPEMSNDALPFQMMIDKTLPSIRLDLRPDDMLFFIPPGMSRAL
jgi:hypothetical protein